MINGIGNDIIEIERIQGVLDRHGQRFLEKTFTAREQEYCLKHREAARHLAGRFAAKEAVVKALGTGFGESVSFLDIEIVNDAHGKPLVVLSERVSMQFKEPKILISISHCIDYAAAVAVWC